MDDGGIRYLINGVERSVLVLALADAGWADLKARVISNISMGAKRLMEDEWAYLRADGEAISRAQKTMLECLATLLETGLIIYRNEPQ